MPVGSDFVVFFVGLYCLACGVMLLTDTEGLRQVVDGLKSNAAILFLGSIAALLFGVNILNNMQSDGSAAHIVVLVLGWMAFIEGLLMLALRGMFASMVGAMPMSDMFLRILGLVSFALGAWLVLAAM